MNSYQNLAPPSCGATRQSTEVILDAVRTAAHSIDPLGTEEITLCIERIKTIFHVRKMVSTLNKKLGLKKLLTRLYSPEPDQRVVRFKQLQSTQIVAIGLSVQSFVLNRCNLEDVDELVVSAPHLQRKLGSQIFDNDIRAIIAGLQIDLSSDYTAFLAAYVEACSKPPQSPEHQPEIKTRQVAPTSEADPAASHTVPPGQALSIATSTTRFNQPVPTGLEPSPEGGKADAVNRPPSNNARQPQSPNRKRRGADELGGHTHYTAPKDAVLNRRRHRADIEYNRKQHRGMSPPQPRPPLSSSTWVANTVAPNHYSVLDPSAPAPTISTFNANPLTASWQQQNLSNPQDDFSQTFTRPDLQVQHHTWLSTPHSASAASHPMHVELSDVSSNVSDNISDNLCNPRPGDVNFGHILTRAHLQPVLQSSFDPAPLQSNSHLGCAGISAGDEIRVYLSTDTGFDAL